MNLKIRTFKAIRWTAVGVAGKGALQFAQIISLGHLMTPSELGMTSLVSTISSIALGFSDFGINNVIMHSKFLDARVRSSLYWLNLMIGFLVSLVIISISYPVSVFYNNEDIMLAMICLSPYFTIWSLAQQNKVTSEKDLRFRPLVISELVSAFIGFLATLLCAYFGYGPISISIGLVSSSFCFLLASWIFLSNGWIPSFKFYKSDVTNHLKYGSATVIGGLVGTLNSSIDIIIGAKVIGTEGIGHYSVIKDLMINIAAALNSIASRVGYPLLAAKNNDIESLRGYYLKILSATATVNSPIYLIVFGFKSILLASLFASFNEVDIAILSALSLWGLLRSFAQPIGSLIFAVGRADIALRWNISWLPIFILSALIGSMYGAVGLSLSLLTLGIIGHIPTWRFLVYPLCGAPFAVYFRSFFRPVLAALISVVIMLFVAPTHATYGWIQLFFIYWLPCVFLFNLLLNRETTEEIIQILKAR